jgi:hypothetical protein
MSKRIVVAVALTLAAASARADFDALMRVVSSTRGMHHIWTPGISLARLGVRLVHPAGVHDFQLAIFEGSANIDFEAVLRSTPGTPMVRTHDNRSGETAVIWARPLRGDLMEMLLLAHDPDDQTVVLRAVIDGETLAREISNPRHAAKIAER